MILVFPGNVRSRIRIDRRAAPYSGSSCVGLRLPCSEPGGQPDRSFRVSSDLGGGGVWRGETPRDDASEGESEQEYELTDSAEGEE